MADRKTKTTIWTIGIVEYVKRDYGEAWEVMAVCTSVAAAVGCALRLIEVYGGQWRWDSYRQLWEELPPTDEVDKAWVERRAVAIDRWPANLFPWRRIDDSIDGGFFLYRVEGQ